MTSAQRQTTANSPGQPDETSQTRWRFEAADGDGRRRRGDLLATTRDAALAQLDERGLIAVRLEATATPERKSNQSSPAFERRAAPPLVGAPWSRGKTARLNRAGAFALISELARLVSHDAPLDRALTMITRDCPNISARASAARLHKMLSQGQSLATAIASERDAGGALPPHAPGLIVAGEASGALGDALTRLSDALEREEALRRALTGALAYPIVLTIAGVTAALVLLLGVAPQFERAFAAAGAAAAPEARLLIAASKGLREFGPTFMAIAAVLLATMPIVLRWPRARAAWADFRAAAIREAPGIGAIAADRDAGRWAAAVSALLASGATVSEALVAARASIVDPQRGLAADDALMLVERGEPLSDALRRSPLWPSLLQQYARLGEETGRLAKMLAYSASVLETEAERRAKTLATGVGPFLVLILGALIGVFVSTMFSAVLSVNDLAL